jgi:hypothetical protein
MARRQSGELYAFVRAKICSVSASLSMREESAARSNAARRAALLIALLNGENFDLNTICRGNMAQERDSRDKFVELANKRVTRTIKDLRLIGNLANRRAYTYDENDAKKIVRALQREVDILKARFRGDDGDDGSIFSL